MRYYFALTIVPFAENFRLPENWSALAGQQTIGCGMNVVSYLGLVDEDFARGKTCVLDRYGTSIFKLYDYYVSMHDNKLRNQEERLMIIRINIDTALHWIVTTLSRLDETNGYGIMFKMYQEGQTEKGHTVAVTKMDGVVTLTDPQLAEIYRIPNADSIEEQSTNFKNMFKGIYRNFVTVDLCFTIRKTQFQDTRPNEFLFSGLDGSPQSMVGTNYKWSTLYDNIINRDVNKTHGGINKKSKNKRNKKNKKNKKTKKTNRRIVNSR